MTKRQRKQYLLVPLTDSNFADDIAFLSNTTQAANRLLQRVEEKVKLLRLNERHSKQSAWFSSNNTRPPTKQSYETLKSIDDFQYLEFWKQSTKKCNMRIGLARSVLNKSSTILDSGLSR